MSALPANKPPAGNIGPFGRWDEPRVVRFQMTPELAAWILEHANGHNRKMSPGFVRRFAADIIAGLWKDNGDSIRFDWNGQLLDGQHRLAAIVESGVTLLATVTLGLDPAVYDTIDQGRHRDRGQVFEQAYRGTGLCNNPVVTAAVAAMVSIYEDGGRSFYGGRNQTPVSTPSLMKLMAERPALIASAAFGESKGRSAKTRLIEAYPRVLGSCHYLFGVVDAPLRDFFFQALESGAGLDETDPVLAVRRKLARLTKESAKWTRTHAIQGQMQCLVKAWNACRTSKPLSGIVLTFATADHKRFADIPDII
jgi:hypothetical protein